MVLSINEQGALTEAVVSRYHDHEKKTVPFGISVDKEQNFGGYTIPTEIRGGWFPGTERFQETFQFTVTDAKFL